MANDITLPGTGAVVNTRQQADNSHNQVVEVDGELLTTLQSLTLALEQIGKSIGLMMPDTAGRMRVSLDAATNVSSIGNVTTLTNQVQMGGFNANDQIPALMNSSSRLLRPFIVVS